MRPSSPDFSRHTESYRLIAELGQFALSDQPLPKLFELVALRLQQGLEIELCGILEVQENGEFLLTSGAGWDPGSFRSSRLSASEASQAAYTLKTSGPVVVRDFNHETRFDKPSLPESRQVVSGLSVVISGRGQPYGVLVAYADKPGHFSESDVHFVQALANILGEAVRRTRTEAELQAANAQLERRVHERSEALLETSVRLRQSEELFRALFDDAATGVVLIDFEGRFLEANSAFTKIVGFEHDELLERDFWEISHPDDVGLERQLFSELVEGGRLNYQLEKRCLTKACKLVWVHLATSLVRDAANRPLCALATVQDMTVRKEAEKALRESQEHFQTIFKSGPIASCINTLNEGRILDVNAQFERLTGYRRDEVIGRTIDELKIWLEPRKRRVLIDTIRRRGYARSVEFKLCDKVGVHKTVLGSYERLELAGEDHLLVMFEDISGRKRLEDDLAEARLKLADLRERERLKLARELHDGAVQQLIGISYGLDQTQKQIPTDLVEAEALAEDLLTHRQGVLGVARQLRSLISNLRPAGLQELGLVATLESIISHLRGEAGEGFPDIQARLEPIDVEPGEKIAVCFLRVAQEALRNAVKHSRASCVEVTLDRAAGSLYLEICDDGQGFSVPPQLDNLARDNHFGLIGMQERVSSVGGEFILRSSPGQGTVISVRVPFESEEQRHA